MNNNENILPISEHFYSLQGEGKNTGKASYFIRLSGCNLSCNWCDSRMSWKISKNKYIDINKIINEVLKSKAKNVVITGGEPTIHNLLPLTSLLKKNNITTCLETSGAYEITGVWDWICVSPKKHKPPKIESLQKANEIKIIIFDNDDFKWAKQCSENTNKNCLLYLQPEWSKYKKNINTIVDFIKENPEWQLSLQTHKFINIR